MFIAASMNYYSIRTSSASIGRSDDRTRVQLLLSPSFFVDTRAPSKPTPTKGIQNKLIHGEIVPTRKTNVYNSRFSRVYSRLTIQDDSWIDPFPFSEIRNTQRPISSMAHDAYHHPACPSCTINRGRQLVVSKINTSASPGIDARNRPNTNHIDYRFVSSTSQRVKSKLR